jgi:hypothetical protein
VSDYNDLFGGETEPPPRRRRIVHHQPAENALVFFPTLGSREREADLHMPPGGVTEMRADAPFVRKSATSQVAAKEITPKLVGKRLAVLQEVCGTDLRHGFTDNELIRHMVEKYGWSPNTPRARRIELVAGGWLLSSSSILRNRSTIWIPSHAAREWYEKEHP